MSDASELSRPRKSRSLAQPLTSRDAKPAMPYCSVTVYDRELGTDERGTCAEISELALARLDLPTQKMDYCVNTSEDLTQDPQLFL